ncbi:neuritin-like protein isoform X2 [Macaca fascicularis]|uniref:neuritin-like protein isoform X2 n=1 Tax=Macaca fascicularis TaxID=9541 RepID=UPI0032B07E2A
MRRCHCRCRCCWQPPRALRPLLLLPLGECGRPGPGPHPLLAQPGQTGHRVCGNTGHQGGEELQGLQEGVLVTSGQKQLQWAQTAVTPYTRASPSVSSAWGTAWAAEASWRPSADLGMTSMPVPLGSCWAVRRRQLQCGNHYSKKLAGPPIRITCTLCAAPRCMFGSAVQAPKPTRRHCQLQHLHSPWPLRPHCWRLLWL